MSAVPGAPVIVDLESPSRGSRPATLAVYFVLGVLFGVVLTKSEAVSWFRIQEMFRFQAFHMYGILASAVVVAALGIAVIRRYQLRTLDGEAVEIPRKALGRGTRYWVGGTLFGIGWAFTGACPGPLFALVGGGVTVISVAVLGALLGTMAYGMSRDRLPH